MFKSIFLLFIVTMNTSVFSAENCRNISLLNQPQSCSSFLGVRDQEKIGNCYAVSASQAYDCIRHNEGAVSLANHQTSPIVTSINSKKQEWYRDLFGMNDDIDIGSFCQTIKSINTQGSCNYHFIEKRIFGQQKAYDYLKIVYVNKENKSIELSFEKIRRYFRHNSRLPLSFTIAEFSNWMKSKNFTHFLSSFFGHFCQGQTKRYKKIVSCDNHYNLPFRRDSLKKLISQNLELGKPIGLTYNPCILKHGKSWKENCNTLDRMGHISLIVASRVKDNKCQYLIKNSWGQRPNGHHPDWEKVPEIGGVWIDENPLFSFSINISTLSI